VAYGEVMELALSLGGTITGEHGVGRLKKPWLPDYLGPDAMDLNRRVKAALDPLGILNPAPSSNPSTSPPVHSGLPRSMCRIRRLVDLRSWPYAMIADGSAAGKVLPRLRGDLTFYGSPVRRSRHVVAQRVRGRCFRVYGGILGG
jgi:hypothetical protein